MGRGFFGPAVDDFVDVQGHFLVSFAREGVEHLVLSARELFFGVVQVGEVFVAAHTDVGGVAIAVGGGHDVGAVEGSALGLVQGGGVAVVDVVVGFGVEGDELLGVVEADLQGGFVDFFERAEGAVLYSQVAVVFQKAEPVAGRELSLSAGGFY